MAVANYLTCAEPDPLSSHCSQLLFYISHQRLRDTLVALAETI